MSVTAPTTRAALAAVLASIGAAITSIEITDYGDGAAAAWTLSRGIYALADQQQPLCVALHVRGGTTAQQPRLAARDTMPLELLISWSVRLRPGAGAGSSCIADQAAAIASAFAIAAALRTWGDEASGARIAGTTYPTFSPVDGAPDWLRVDLTATLHLPWRP